MQVTANSERVEQSALSHYIRQVKGRIASKIYETEEVLCYCGSNESFAITKNDRYGFNHQMNLCTRCGIIYANPRMTEESYRKFYENEYRHIYDYGKDMEAEYQADFDNGINLKSFISHFDIKPSSILDIGCNQGAMLKPFQDAGIPVVGIDYSNIPRDDMEIFRGTFAQFPEDRKFDFIIMHHVLEHLLDIETALNKVTRLLNKDGYVYVGVPALYRRDLSGLFQNAHTYQFTAGTLNYVMNTCGFEEVYCDEQICSLWQYIGEKIPKCERPNEAAEISSFLHDSKKIRTIKTINKFSLSKRKHNMDMAYSYKFDDIHMLEGIHKEKPAIIIGGGPSIDGQIDMILKLKRQGGITYVIERMYSWCLSHDIIPDYVIVLDASDDVIESFDNIHPDVTHLIATQCNKDIFDKLSDCRKYIFATPQKGINFSDFWDKYGYGKVTIINAGGSVTIACMSIALTLGCDKLHIFGFDCYISDKQYATGITGVGEQKHVYEIKVEERIFKVTNSYLSFVQQFAILMEIARKKGMIKEVVIYGDSLVNAMWINNIKEEVHV